MEQISLFHPSKAKKSNMDKQSRKKTDTNKVAPMIGQYLDIKRQYPQTILFYRMGDFYEMFFDDALKAASILDITLTKRGLHLGKDIPMCGVPVHQAENYLRKLIAHGEQVTICEQTETPEEAKKRAGSKALVNREPVRMVTAGTILEDELLEPGRSNHLAALAVDQQSFTLAWLEIASGAFFVQSVDQQTFLSLLSEIEPDELLINETLPPNHADWLMEQLQPEATQLSPIPSKYYNFKNLPESLRTQNNFPAPLQDYEEIQHQAACAVLSYVCHTQIGKLPNIQRLEARKSQEFMLVDAATRRNLELVRTLNGEKSGSLFAHLDRCKTSAGKRLFVHQLLSPLTDIQKINQRLDRIDELSCDNTLRAKLRDTLAHCPDMMRPLSRLQLLDNNPRDLLSISLALEAIRNLKHAIISSENTLVHQDMWKGLPLPEKLMAELQQALNPEMPKKITDGEVINKGYDEALDHQRELTRDAHRLMMALQAQLQEDTGVEALKIKSNNMLGYFVEIPKRFAQKLPDQDFIYRGNTQTVARYSHTELIELSRSINQAHGAAKTLEQTIYNDLRQQTLDQWQGLQTAAELTAKLDVAASLSELALEENYCRPELSNDLRLEIVAGRHPVVERSLKNQKFIANDCLLHEKQRLWLLSGPNMAGKSTFLRQNALIVLMAQMGSYVPAKSVKMGIVDQLFSRVGAADDLARGHSTFMVEMLECASILNRATPKSMVILDEIGRGTATYDGLSLAWACVEYLHNHNRSRSLFATHYHELSEALEDTLDHLASFHMKVKEWQGEIIFQHEVAEGKALGSYGIHVAKLAGLPKPVINRAQAILRSLEKQAIIPDTETIEMMTLEETNPVHNNVIARLQALDADALSPKEALGMLYELCAELKE